MASPLFGKILDPRITDRPDRGKSLDWGNLLSGGAVSNRRGRLRLKSGREWPLCAGIDLTLAPISHEHDEVYALPVSPLMSLSGTTSPEPGVRISLMRSIASFGNLMRSSASVAVELDFTWVTAAALPSLDAAGCCAPRSSPPHQSGSSSGSSAHRRRCRAAVDRDRHVEPRHHPCRMKIFFSLRLTNTATWPARLAS
jgi:hypothetical protein